MKTKLIQQTCLAFIAALALFTPSPATAGGNSGQMIAKFHSPKDAGEIDQLKPGDTVVKVCRSCNQVTLVRVVKGGKGYYDYVAKKCEDCGSTDTFTAISNQDIPFKERVKR